MAKRGTGNSGTDGTFPLPALVVREEHPPLHVPIHFSSQKPWKRSVCPPVSPGFPHSSVNASVTNRTYGPAGNVTSITDPNGVQTNFDYSGSLCGTPTFNPNLYPNSVTTAYLLPESRRHTYAYDCSLGLPASITDQDNGITQSFVYDIFGRKRSVTDASGTPLVRNTNWVYDDLSRKITQTDDLDVNGVSTTTTTTYDDLARERLRTSTDDNGGLITVETRYQFLPTGGSVKLVSNPYRPTTDATMGWTLTTFDEIGRPVSVETFAGATMPSPFGLNTSSTGRTAYAYNAQDTTITEPDNGSGIQVTRTQRVDGLGRLTQVIDATGTTSYAYDPPGNLITVSQGVQTRTFLYDSLSRLSSATNPETGTISYAYDANGNLLTRTDGRPVTTTMTYDGQNTKRLEVISTLGSEVRYERERYTNLEGE